jgi:16S rRNA (adenine1518-N6/adenine1519-N6)-dimethyltransferase
MRGKPSSDKRSISTELYPTKRLGQHFLRDPRSINRIVEAFAPAPNETVIEIGPGTGALTAILLQSAARVVAIEFDRKLTPLLLQRFGNLENFKLVSGDALQTSFCDEIKPATQARLVANLPYNISTAILQRLIAQRHCLTEMVVMLQREVVERILAPAGSSERGFLSVLIEGYCETEKLFDVAPGSFRPPPKVWSSVLRLKFRPGLAVKVKEEELLWATVSAGFAQKRKTILNNLRNSSGGLQQAIQKNGGASIVLCKAEVELQRRAETLTIEEWGRIVRAME